LTPLVACSSVLDFMSRRASPDPKALQALEDTAIAHMEGHRYDEALRLWELRLTLGDLTLLVFPLYARCLAATGRLESARDVCRRTATAIAKLEAGERKEELARLLRRVVKEMERAAPAVVAKLPAGDVDTLFAGEAQGSKTAEEGEEDKEDG
jgi:hypothetical protein